MPKCTDTSHFTRTSHYYSTQKKKKVVPASHFECQQKAKSFNFKILKKALLKYYIQFQKKPSDGIRKFLKQDFSFYLLHSFRPVSLKFCNTL